MHTPTFFADAQLRSTTPTKRAAEPTTLNVPHQAKHPRAEGSQMDVRNMTVAGVAKSGTEDEHPLVDGSEADEMTKAKQKELDRLAEFGVHETVDLHVALGKKRVTTRWDLDPRKDGIRARVVAREFKGDETMHDVCQARLRTRDAPSTA